MEEQGRQVRLMAWQIHSQKACNTWNSPTIAGEKRFATGYEDKLYRYVLPNPIFTWLPSPSPILSLHHNTIPLPKYQPHTKLAGPYTNGKNKNAPSIFPNRQLPLTRNRVPFFLVLFIINSLFSKSCAKPRNRKRSPYPVTSNSWRRKELQTHTSTDAEANYQIYAPTNKHLPNTTSWTLPTHPLLTPPHLTNI